MKYPVVLNIQSKPNSFCEKVLIHSDPKVRIPFGNWWGKPIQFLQYDLFWKIMFSDRASYDISRFFSNISFSSSDTQFYESRFFCLFTFWVFFPDKSFKLISKYTQNCQYNSLYKKEKITLQPLKLGKLKFEIRKIGLIWWAQRDIWPWICWQSLCTNELL